MRKKDLEKRLEWLQGEVDFWKGEARGALANFHAANNAKADLAIAKGDLESMKRRAERAEARARVAEIERDLILTPAGKKKLEAFRAETTRNAEYAKAFEGVVSYGSLLLGPDWP